MISGVRLLRPLSIGRVIAPNRVLFGPIVTNLADDERAFTPRHTAFYDARAAGGCAVIVTEEAAVHPSDWPYERSPLAGQCADGWRAIAAACHRHGSLVVAALGHSGGQGSSAYSQAPMLAPSRVAEVNSREVPKSMEADDIAAIVDGFADAARLAIASGCDGVEINAGQHSLVRQFLSGLTNQRDDEWGTDRLKFAKDVLATVRSAIGPEPIIGLRLSGDELAPWAGITPEAATGIATALIDPVDYLVVVRGSIYSVEKTRPDFHEPPGFNIELCRAVKAAVGSAAVVVLQGSLTDPRQAEWALEEELCDAVEMTRAQLADPHLVAKLTAGTTARITPCILCNQTCQVRDARNPIITCVVEPSTGHEIADPDWYSPTPAARDVLVVGGGVAGLEAARVAAIKGHRVGLVDASTELGGNAARIAHARPFAEWLIAEAAIAGVSIHSGTSHPDDGTARRGGNRVVVQCTGSVAGIRPYSSEEGAIVLDVADLRASTAELPSAGPVAIFDPIGGPIAVALAEHLGHRAVLITQDQIAGNELSRTGDLAPANSRLQQAGVSIERRSILRHVAAGTVTVEDRFTGQQRDIPCVALVDCGFRLPAPALPDADLSAGDCVAPRTILEAVLEGRRAAQAIDALTRH
jgi:mycofactocin system FadH/OYE family oxidoreductase 1